MANDKKRSIETVVDNDDVEVDVSPVDKKVKKDKKNEKELRELDLNDSRDSKPKPSSEGKPMERKKKRKLLDKVRHVGVSETDGSKPKLVKLSADKSVVPSSSGNGGLPEFHIGVFNKLSSIDASVRESAVESLVKELVEVQEAYEKCENKEVFVSGTQLEAEKDDGLNNCAPSLRYAIRRLIRGVSSSRECSRQGFGLGLTVLVARISSIQVDSLMKLITSSLEVTSSMKGQEARDCYLGRLFAYGALVRSGRLIEEWNSNKNTSYIKEFTSFVVSLAAKKRYLQEPAVVLILDLVEKLPTEALLNHVLQSPGLSEFFDGAIEVGNPDALLLALKLREKIQADDAVFGKLLPNPLGYETLFSNEHMSSLVNCLKESTFCQPRVHSVWPVLLNILLPDTVLQEESAASGSSSIKKHKKNRKINSSEDLVKSIRCFNEVIIEGALLQSSHDRKHLALDVLLLVLPRLPASFIPIVLSYKLVQCLMDVLSTKDTWLNKVALHFLKEISELVKDDDSRRVSVISALQKHSNGKFDCVTRTRTVRDLIAEFMSESGCMMFIQNVMSMFVDDGDVSEEPSDQSQTTDDNSEIGSVEDKDTAALLGSSDSLKSWTIESLPSILKHPKLDPEAKFRVQKEVLKFLAVQGLFSSSLGTEVTSFELQEKFRWPKAATSISLCKMCVEQLSLLLATAQKAEGPRPLANGLDQIDLGSYFMRFFSTIHSIPSVSLFRSLSNEDEKALENLQTTETKLVTEERNCGLSTNANKFHSLRYLLIQVMLQLLLQPGDFAESAAELIICCKKVLTAPDHGDSSEEELDDGEAPELMDVLVDTLLSMLPHSSASMRYAIEQVFRYFCENVTDDGLLRMLRVIRKGLKPPRRPDYDSEDQDDDDDLLGIEEADDEESDEAETRETGESDEQTEDSEAAVVRHQTDSNKEHSDESDDDSDSGMDDDAMFRMDSYLVKIFKERKNQGGEENADAQLVLFKLRVLSLLEIYLHENPGKPQVLTVYSNLAQAYLNPHTVEVSEQLGQRIWGILQKKIFKAKELPKGEAVHLSTLETLLEKNLKLVSRSFKKKKCASNPSKKKQSTSLNRYKTIISLAQNSTFWILSIVNARNFSTSELQKIVDTFQISLEGYFRRRESPLKSEFLKEIFRRRPWVGHNLFGFLLEKCGSARREFRKVEALDLVMDILKSLVPSTSDNGGLKKILNNHLQNICILIKDLATSMPEKQSRQTQVKKFCVKVCQIVSSHNLNKSFLNELGPDGQAACESAFSEAFLALTDEK